MKNLLVKTMVGIFVCSMMTLAFSTNSNARDKRITFGGGPAGGTFQVVANAIQVYQPVKDIGGINVKAQTSAGSVENLRKTNAGKQDMSVVYSGHVWLGRNGKMKNDPSKYEDVLAVAWLYGAQPSWWSGKGQESRASRTWLERRWVSAMQDQVRLPTVNSSLAILASGTRLKEMQWDITTQLPHSATSNLMPSGCSPPFQAAP